MAPPSRRPARASPSRSLRVPTRSLSGRRSLSRRVERPHRARGRHLGELRRALDAELEAAAPDALERDSARPPAQPAAQDEQPRLEVVVAGRQPEGLVQTELAVGELRASGRRVLAQELVEDAPGNALDDVLAVAQNAVVSLVVDDGERRAA